MALITELYAKTKTLVKKGKGFFSVSGGKYADAILGGVLWLFIAKFLPQAKYGLIIYWYAVGLLLASISTLGYNTSIKTLLPKGKRKITAEGNFLSLLPTFISMIILALFIPFNIFGVLLYLFFRNRHGLSMAEVLGERKYQEFFYAMIGKRAIQIVACLGLYTLMGVNGILIGLSLGLAATSYRSFNQLLSLPSFDLSISKAHSSYILYTFAMATVWGVTANLDRLLIKTLYGSKLLGAYAFIAQITTFLIMLPRSFKGYLLPEKSAGRKAKLAEMIGIGGSIFLSVLTLLFSPWGVTRFFNKFTGVIPAIRIVSLTPILAMFSTILTTTFLSKEKGHTPFITAVVSRSARIGGVLSLYWFFDVIGIGTALLLEQCARILVLWIRRSKK